MREEAYPLSITVIHSHAPISHRGMPCIRADGYYLISHRASPESNLTTSLLFTWCDGYQSTIEDAAKRLVGRSVNLRDLILCLVKDVGQIFCDEDITFSIILSWLVSRHGAQIANEQCYDQRTIDRLRLYLSTLRKDVELQCSSSFEFACEEDSEFKHDSEPDVSLVPSNGCHHY